MRIPTSRRLKTFGPAFGLVIALTAGVFARGAHAADVPYEWKAIPRIVAVGDVHGAYGNFVAILRTAGLIDAELHWIGGTAHLVQTGDVLDRGPESRKAMDLLMKIEREAERAGGRVHALIGNHEAMNVVGLLGYVSPREFASYADASSEERREQAFRFDYQKKKEAERTGATPLPEDEARRAFQSQYPLGYVEHRLAFAPRGRYGSWILAHNVAVRINGVVFSHGDWSEEMAALGIAEVNERVREELSGKRRLEDGVTFHPRSPLQYRGISKLPLARTSQEAHDGQVSRILTNLEARLMVVGHTVTQGLIEPRFAGRHISIDAGMLDLYDGGHRVALEMKSGMLRAIHPRGSVELPDGLNERDWSLYMTAVAAVDPANGAVHKKVDAASPAESAHR